MALTRHKEARASLQPHLSSERVAILVALSPNTYKANQEYEKHSLRKTFWQTKIVRYTETSSAYTRVIWENTEGNHVWLIIFCAMNSYYTDLIPVQLPTLNCVLISVVGFYGVDSLTDWNMLQHVGWYSWYNLTHPLWKIVLEFKWGKLIYRKKHAFFLFSDLKKQYISNLLYLLPLHCLPGSSLQILEWLPATSENNSSYIWYIWFFS